MVWTVMFLHRDGWMHWFHPGPVSFKQAALPGCSTGALLPPRRWGESLRGDVLVVPHLFSGPCLLQIPSLPVPPLPIKAQPMLQCPGYHSYEFLHLHIIPIFETCFTLISLRWWILTAAAALSILKCRYWRTGLPGWWQMIRKHFQHPWEGAWHPWPGRML